MDDRKGPSYLSPSGLSAWLKCQASWWHTYMEDHPREPATVEQVRGTFVHEVMERIAWLPAPMRTVEAARGVARDVWMSWLRFGANADFTALELTDPEDYSRFADWTWRSIQRALPYIAESDVAATELKVRVDLDGAPFGGVIDIVTEWPRGVRPEDWKTGERPVDEGRPWDKSKIAGAMLQPLLYAAALREMGHTPWEAALVYVPAEGVEGEIADRCTDEALDQAVATLSKAWSEIQEAIERDELPERTTSPLCSWCNHLALCPEGQVEVEARFRSGRNVGERAVEILGLS